MFQCSPNFRFGKIFELGIDLDQSRRPPCASGCGAHSRIPHHADFFRQFRKTQRHRLLATPDRHAGIRLVRSNGGNTFDFRQTRPAHPFRKFEFQLCEEVCHLARNYGIPLAHGKHAHDKNLQISNFNSQGRESCFSPLFYSPL